MSLVAAAPDQAAPETGCHYVELDLRNGDLTLAVHATDTRDPSHVRGSWYGCLLRWSLVRPFAGRAAQRLMARIRPLADRVRSGAQMVWHHDLEGSWAVGHLDPTARTASLEIRGCLLYADARGRAPTLAEIQARLRARRRDLRLQIVVDRHNLDVVCERVFTIRDGLRQQAREEASQGRLDTAAILYWSTAEFEATKARHLEVARLNRDEAALKAFDQTYSEVAL